MDRREAVRLMAGAALLPQMAAAQSGKVAGGDARTIRAIALSAEDDAFLDDMTRRGCLYFVEQASASNGQVLDRAAFENATGKRDSRTMASIAATGFGLTALCIAEKRGYQTRAAALAQVRRTLRFHLKMVHDHGFLSHFNDIGTGLAMPGSEISSIDTSLLLCGVLTARAHFADDAETVALATRLYERVDWPWMLNGGTTFSMGLRQGAFLNARWNHYCELMMLNLLALGSPTHPVAAETWDAWSRPVVAYAGRRFIGGSDPLFVHQYSHAWFDFRGQQDKYADYFANSVTATEAHRAFCLALGGPYAAEYWGISASDSAHGYTAWGGPAAADYVGSPDRFTYGAGLNAAAVGRSFGGVDGSVVPNAAAGSLAFVPGACLRTLRALKAQYGDKVYGRYGFRDAFHPAAGWFDPDVLGIDLGIGLVMAENLRTGFVWQTFGRNPEVGTAMRRAGFRQV